MVICSNWTDKLKGAAKAASFFSCFFGSLVICFILYVVLNTRLCGYGNIVIWLCVCGAPA